MTNGLAAFKRRKTRFSALRKCFAKGRSRAQSRAESEAFTTRSGGAEIGLLAGPLLVVRLGPLFDELFRRHGVEGDDDPVPLGHDALVPDIDGDRNPPLFEVGGRIANQ